MKKKILCGLLAICILFIIVGCVSNKDNTNSDSNSNPSNNSSSTTTSEYPELSAILNEVESKYKQETFEDSKTSKTIKYNIYLPDNYDSSKKYPLLVFIADSSLVGRGTIASLEQGYGGVIWATSEDQSKHEAIIVVPVYDEVIIDDMHSYTTTDYLDATKNLIDSISSKYSVDSNRIYGTGQSMGGMTMLYLASKYPDLFAAELFVSCQWRIEELNNLDSQTFFYVVAGGDQKASAGQKEVLEYLQDKNIKVSTLSDVDATLTNSEFTTKINDMLKDNNKINMLTFKSGTVTSSSSSSSGMGSSEHMSSFNYAYRISAIRDWLFEQGK